MKFTITTTRAATGESIASSLSIENFSELMCGCASALVDIRNPSATISNLKAAAMVKLKIKKPLDHRLVAVVRSEGNGAASNRVCVVLDELDADKAKLLSAVFPSASSADSVVNLYCVDAADCSAFLDAAEVSGVLATEALTTTVSAPAASTTPPPAVAEVSAGGVKRDRAEGADDADRTVLEKSCEETNLVAAATPSAVAQTEGQQQPPAAEVAVPAAPASSRLRAARDRQAQRGAITAPRGDDEDHDDHDDDDDEDDSDADYVVEEGDEWGDSDDDDGIDWMQGALDLGLVPELAPAERDLITELVALPNASAIIQQVLDGKLQEAMEAVQTASPRLLELIKEHGGLFSELMEDIKDMMSQGLITNEEGVIEHLKAMVDDSAQLDDILGDDDGDEELEEEGEEGEGGATSGSVEERRRARRAQNEAAMHDAMNAFAGGASDMRPLLDVDEDRIKSLMDLGFDRTKAVAAYLRMGRNVERAANYLFENM